MLIYKLNVWKLFSLLPFILVVSSCKTVQVDSMDSDAISKLATREKFTYIIKYDETLNEWIINKKDPIKIKNNGAITWKAEKNNHGRLGSKELYSYKIKFFSDENKSKPIDCSFILNSSSRHCSSGIAISNAQQVKGKIKCKNSPCNKDPRSAATESYWFTVYDIKYKLKGSNVVLKSKNVIDPRIIIKNS